MAVTDSGRERPVDPEATGAPLPVLFASSELGPWMKTGGLGDVTAALPRALASLGMEVRVLVPGYPELLDAFPRRRTVAVIAPFAGLPGASLSTARLAPRLSVLILECPTCFDRPGGPYVDARGEDWADNALRFGLLSRTAALLASVESPLAWRPRVLHCNDWQTALAPAYLRYVLQPTAASVVTIHNLAFQGLFAAESLQPLGLPAHAFTFDGVEFYGQLSFLKAGLQCCDRITTVSPTYAEEIRGPELGCGLDGLLRFRAGQLEGILNGIDTRTWNPARDRLLPARYSLRRLAGKQECRKALEHAYGFDPDPAGPILGMVSRLTQQKGVDLTLAAVDALIAGGVRIAVLGSGEQALEQAWRAAADPHPGRVSVRIGFDEGLAHLIEAGADVFLMPSRFEPCGLNQMYSLAYGTPPVVRSTGGLADTVVDCTPQTLADGTANGFCFVEPTPQALFETVLRAVECWHDRATWRRIQRNGMAQDFSWSRAAGRYKALYQELVAT